MVRGHGWLLKIYPQHLREIDSLVPRAFLKGTSYGVRVSHIDVRVNQLASGWTYPVRSIEVLVTYEQNSESRQFLHKFSI